MSRAIFEARSHDAAGRLGRLRIPRANCTVETPALLPVVNPHIQDIEPAELATEFGAEILITNAYVLFQSEELRTPAETDGIHAVLDFPGAVMTDSGSFQLAEYGTIDVDTETILSFQDSIGSDIATPVDIPTSPDASRERAEADLTTTNEALATAAAYPDTDMLISAPIQGGRFPDLRTAAARQAAHHGLDVYPVGAVVPLLRRYEFGTIAELVIAAKQGLGVGAPVHLFGAGHPMMFALGVALGCDLFDSAAYALYARDGRYMTISGTETVEALDELPCSCPICLRHTSDSLAANETDLARHNLYVSFAEMRRIKEAIRAGTLLELVESRVRAHPHLLDGYRTALESPAHFETNDPVTARRPFFYLSAESARRPAVTRHHERLSRIRPDTDILLIDSTLLGVDDWPSPWDSDLGIKLDGAADAASGEVWILIPPFGPVPVALTHTYPLNAEVPTIHDMDAYRQAIVGLTALCDHFDGSVTFLHDGMSEELLGALPPSVNPAAASEVPI